jgi:membrane fusion protein (multidrug efflux system)
MNLILFAMRRPFTNLLLIVALAGGDVLGVSKVRADILPPLKTTQICADLGLIGTRAKHVTVSIAGYFESYFQRQNEQPKQGRHKIVLTSPKAMDVTVTQRYVCQIHSRRHIKIRALETGNLEEISVKGGEAVKKGAVMFKIATLRAKAKADGAKAESNIANVIAPFDGIVGRVQEQVGSRIKEGDALTTLSDNSVMWVYFHVPEKQYLEYMANRKQHEESKVELELANQTKFPQPGQIGAIDAQFDSDTGNIAFRADFPNSEGLLRHGQSGTILIHRKLHDALVIPQRAVFENLAKQYVYVVGEDHVVHQREIVIQNEMEDIFVIKKGVGVGDRIILEGIRDVRDGEKVEYEFRPPEEVLRKLKNQAD